MFYIRVDANETIATGHVMRCLSIADAAKKLGEDTIFIMADDSAECLIKSRGYNTVILHTPWDDMEQEIEKIIPIIRSEGIQDLLIDSYQVTEKYLRTLSKETKIAYIDDIDRFIYPVDTLICYAAYAEKFGYPSKYADTKLLLGTKYAPLRQEFFGIGKKVIHDKVGRILVLSGGTDPMNVLQQILDEMTVFKGIYIDAVCGIYNPNFDMLQEQYISHKNISLHHSIDNIVDYMKSADIAISAAGTTLYELCACGTPAISYVIADNQTANAEWFDENNIIEFAGDARLDDIGHNLARIMPKYWNRAYRESISVKMQELVDGRGARRIAELLIDICF